jgi:membrane-associated phospholipid phosphatase
VVLVLAAAVLVAVVVAAAVAVAARCWPLADPAAPSGRSVAAELAEHPEAAEVGDELGPARATILGLSAAAVAVVVSATLFGLLVLAVRTRTGFDAVDLGPTRWAAEQPGGPGSIALQVLTVLGSTWFALPLIVVVGVAEARRLPNRAIAGFLALVEVGQLALVNIIKLIVARARPDLDQLASVSTHSFPSGHTATAAATFAALALVLGRQRTPAARRALAAAAAGVTALVASSRVLLGVHWVTDVLAGAALGWGWAALCSIAFGGRLLRFGAPAEAAEPTGSPPVPLPHR